MILRLESFASTCILSIRLEVGTQLVDVLNHTDTRLDICLGQSAAHGRPVLAVIRSGAK